MRPARHPAIRQRSQSRPQCSATSLTHRPLSPLASRELTPMPTNPLSALSNPPIPGRLRAPVRPRELSQRPPSSTNAPWVCQCLSIPPGLTHVQVHAANRTSPAIAPELSSQQASGAMNPNVLLGLWAYEDADSPSGVMEGHDALRMSKRLLARNVPYAFTWRGGDRRARWRE
ncbi:hypothetical protein BD413DRAFT_217429 [Trametes elegans]|nr:hypothetical protein BD413DRAFT_217429 [Trametes elegans]